MVFNATFHNISVVNIYFKGSVYEFNCTKAVNTCINKARKLPLTSKSSNIVSWLGYFSVRELLNGMSEENLEDRTKGRYWNTRPYNTTMVDS
jgi:hypothetical protein